MTGRIFTSTHQTYDLPPLLSWSVVHTGTVPCDSYTVTCLYSKEMAPILPLAAGFIGFEDGQLVARGIVDDFSVTSTVAAPPSPSPDEALPHACWTMKAAQ